MNKAIKTPIRNFSLHNILKCQERFKISNGVKILIISIAVFGAGFLFVPSTFAQDNLVVEFEQTPLFNEANFLPGQGVTRWIKVTNNSDQTQRIATEAINVNDPNRLGDVLNLEIKEGGTTRYNDAFSKFFTAGEVYLSDLAGSETQTQYDFVVSFYSGAGNPFQGKTLSFDILIGFQGSEGGLLPGAGGGAGGFLPPGLTIQDESVRITTTTETSVTIIWTTSYFSTSQVIYGKEGEAHTLDLTDNVGTPPKYGYARTTPEYDTSPKVTVHTVTITGLVPGTKYYFRTVSHASLAISREHSFTTLGGKVEEKVEGEIPSEGIPYEEEIAFEEIVLLPIEEGVGEEKISEEGLEPEVKGEEVAAEEEEEGEIEKGIVVEEEKEEEGREGAFLATIGQFFSGLTLKNLLWILLIIAIVLLIAFISSRRRKKKISQS